MERNKVKIICNPYEKTITYKRWIFDENDGLYKWGELGSKSKLIVDEKYINATIQHNAYEIVSEIVDEYNRGNVGLDIIFDGTKEDYYDLKEVIDEFFLEARVKCEIGDFYINSAIEVMPQIQNSFIRLSEFFKEYTSEKVNKIITKFLDSTKTVIPICVVGMYSTGKSAFINALIGAEILPSAVNPTTARNYKIIEAEKNGAIRFSVEKENVVIFYEDDKYNISGNIEKILKDKIHKRLDNLDKNELANNMYHSLCVINEYADETNTISELIEVEVPFYNGVLINDKFKFIIFDTPGSDSESHEEHLEVLKKALGEQTNGLPILLTSPKDMDRTGADKLLEIVNGIDGNLDLTNAMIIVNQADSVSAKSLNKIKEDANTILAQWKANRLYFLSAIMGLGSKKDDYDDEDNWIDEDYLEIFLKNIDSFINEGRRYKQLYTHNQIATNRMNKYVKNIEEKKGERELLYINSGLHCIEKEILEFAKKYALYNKCAQAQDYLDKAIECTKEEIYENECKENEVKKKIECLQDKKKKDLIEKLNKRIKELTDRYIGDYSQYMSKIVYENINISKEKIKVFLGDNWDKAKVLRKEFRIDNFLKISKEDFLEEVEKCREEILKNSKIYWETRKRELQEVCCKLVKEDENLTNEERAFLQKFIMDLNKPFYEVINMDISAVDISKHLVNLFGKKFLQLSIIDKKKAIDLYSSSLENQIRRINNTIKEYHLNKFNDWNNDLKKGLETKITSLNPRLKEISNRLEELQNKIEIIQQQQKSIENEKSIISKMFELKERGDFECQQ